MSIQRRFFLRALVSFIAFTAGSDLLKPLSGKEEFHQTDKLAEGDKFPFKVSVKYYPPEPKNHAQIRKDIKSWGNERAYNEIVSKLENEGVLSTKYARIEHEDFHEFQMAFKDKVSFDEYCVLVRAKSVVDFERQKKLNYKIICETSASV